MDVGSFTSGLLTGLREGVEAALIVSIILAYLARTGNRRHFGKIWIGTAAAVVLSLVAGAALFLTIGGLEEPYEQIFEGLTMLLAAVVVTWMLFWMRRQSASVKNELHAALDRALSDGGAIGLAVLAFTAVIREGLETALFLVGQATSADAAAPAVLVGAVIGLGIAVLLGVGFYRGARTLNLRTFFRWTGVGLVFIAAGLLSQAVHEFVEIGWITIGTQTLFDASATLPHKVIEGAPDGIVLLVGQFLRALFGYSSQPEVITFVVWLTYVAVTLVLFLRPVKLPAKAPAPRPGTSAAA
ncbi:MAG TPA: iron uptake transporter permease EfeU [Candidatus Limnocylindrales bacterium]|nr:iron uptake transporter permease EfeU [Candidatus Limnocylindrales bacterium]